jgi:hypothetical protein
MASTGVIDVLYAALRSLLLKMPKVDDLREFSFFFDKKDTLSALENLRKLIHMLIRELQLIEFDCQILIGETNG